MKLRVIFTFLVLGLCSGLLPLGGAGTAFAQATRTWVSGVGDDVNPCSRTAPCKTFAGAISKTAAGGEISVLDPSGYGALTITKSISVVADGNEGSVLVFGTNGIVINAGPTDQVSIQGVKFEGNGPTGSSLNAIRVISAGAVYVSHVSIRGFKGSPGCGISVEPTANPARVYVNKSEIVANNTGVCVTPSSGVNAAVALDDVVVENNSANSVYVDGVTAGMSLHNSRLSQTPVLLQNGAQLNSHGNNFIAGAVGPTATVPLR